MASNNPTPKSVENMENVGEAISRSEQFIENNQKSLLTAVIVILAIVAGFILFHNYYMLPKEKEAQGMIFKGEYYFSIDSLSLALQGDDNEYIGFEGIMDEYGITKTADLASAYAGLCYKGMNDYEKAVRLLNKSKFGKKNPALVSAVGDCYVELGDYAKAAAAFEKAAKTENEVIAPIALMKAGRAYEALGNYAKAEKMYEQINAEFPMSQEGLEIEKYIDRAKSMK